MNSIEIASSTDLLGQISKMTLPKTKSLSLSIVSTSDNSRLSAVSTINHIANKVGMHLDFYLYMLEDSVIIDPKTIDWSNVTFLQLASPITMTVLVGLLERLPGIFQLILYNFVIDDVSADVHAAQHFLPSKKYTPLNTSISKLMLDYNRAESSEETVAAIIKYLALRLTSLKMFGAWTTFDTEMVAFIDKFKPSYPHLSQLVFKLGIV
ncbi:hypothetical protein IWW36_001363 [Coemansia brasiliensis]|uniref:Uncharacterized protein n=1 Tax=Coemansia brasiliensis TaxID=2650707 RepID=A0A9W8I927_9FUNG|nr:hypothetical protein IWW36_001363 [Coemansia brasiliensis]